MPFVVGILLTCGVFLGERRALVRDRAFYPTLLLVIASYHGLFAAMAALVHALILGAIVMTASVVRHCRVQGECSDDRRGAGGPWMFDAVHGAVLHNAGVPTSYPAFCVAGDVGAAGCLAWAVNPRQPQRQSPAGGRTCKPGRDGRPVTWTTRTT
jgi:hypothetical protein